VGVVEDRPRDADGDASDERPAADLPVQLRLLV